MIQIASLRRRGAGHVAYATVLVFMLTQGPILSWWIRRPENAFTTKDVGIWSTYLVVVLPAMQFWWQARSRAFTRWSPLLWYLLLSGWMCLSFVWSSVPQVTGPAALALLFTTVAGAYLAQYFQTSQLLRIVVVAMVPGLLLSELAHLRHWQYSLDGVPHWTGIYLNRNSLGPPAVVAIFSSAALLAVLAARRWSRWLPLQAAGLVITIVMGFHLQQHGGSHTSWAFLATAIVVAAAWVIAAGLLSRSVVRERIMISISSVLVVGILVVVFAIYVGNNPISSKLGTARDFDGRRIYWTYSWSLAKDHLLVGQGWMSPWFDPLPRVRLPAEIATDTYSHSSYLDVLGGGGLVGAVLGLLAVITSFVQIARRKMSWIVQGWALGFCCAVLIASTQESFVIGFHFYYLLFVALSCSHTTDPAWPAEVHGQPVADNEILAS